ncbi:MAG: EamA family transporter, partial [Bacteroidetes bacterium]|nr:EamA family transporter [Bacteroidota bacterium]
MSDKLKVVLAYTAICTIWGSTWLVIKVGLETMTPLLSAGLRFALAAGILFTIIRLRAIPVPWNRTTRWFFLLTSLTSFSLPFGLVYWGEHRISSGMTSILFATFPLWVTIMSSLMISSEKVTVQKVAGVLLGFSGVVTIFAPDVTFDGNMETVLGMGAVVLSAAIQAFSAVLIKKHGQEISP